MSQKKCMTKAKYTLKAVKTSETFKKHTFKAIDFQKFWVIYKNAFKVENIEKCEQFKNNFLLFPKPQIMRIQSSTCH